MKELPREKIIFYSVAVVSAGAVSYALHKVPRHQSLASHGIFLVASILLLIFLPDWLCEDIFSHGGVLVLGTILPIYESVYVACHTQPERTSAWLQYWLASATFSIATEFLDEITQYMPHAGKYWYQVEFVMTAWLLLPWTDGAGLLYQKVTVPHLMPVVTRFKAQLEGWAQAIMVMVNSYHAWWMWFAFTRLPENERRFLTVALGTLYPATSSTIALSTNEDVEFWLVYWVCYSLLFVVMDYAENWLGRITGFYSLCALATLYLFLPLFRGADVIFRSILVPLSGQYESLLLKDAHVVHKAMLKAIPEGPQREKLLEKTAQLFQKPKQT